MRILPLSQGKVALIDDEDLERLSAFKWCAIYSRKTNSFYAARSYQPFPKTKQRVFVSLHRFILGAKDNEEVDHRDRNGLNNQKSNLRVCSKAQNQANRTVNKNSKSGIKGVKRCGLKWVAIFRHKSLGTFSAAVEAAKAYDQRLRNHFGDFARTNEDMGLI